MNPPRASVGGRQFYLLLIPANDGFYGSEFPRNVTTLIKLTQQKYFEGTSEACQVQKNALLHL